MKKDVYPAYGPLVFRDRSADQVLHSRSTLAATAADTIELDGVSYPAVDVDVQRRHGDGA
jgi:large subunit ribosomal protein L31